MSDSLTNVTEETKNFNMKKPTLRNELPDDVIEYLKETYPPRINGAGIAQSDGIDYITEERSFALSEDVNECIIKYGLEPLGILWFLRLKMANSLGWGIDVTGRKYDKLCMDTTFELYINDDKFANLCNALIDVGIVKVVHDSEGHTYWTTLQQFYNYEYKNWTKLKNNAAAHKYYESKKAQLQAAEQQKQEIQEKQKADIVEETKEDNYF